MCSPAAIWVKVRWLWDVLSGGMCRTSERGHSIYTWRYGSDTQLEAGHREVIVDTVGTDDLAEEEHVRAGVH